VYVEEGIHEKYVDLLEQVITVQTLS